jgi:hypothetical protein
MRKEGRQKEKEWLYCTYYRYGRYCHSLRKIKTVVLLYFYCRYILGSSLGYGRANLAYLKAAKPARPSMTMRIS